VRGYDRGRGAVNFVERAEGKCSLSQPTTNGQSKAPGDELGADSIA